MRKLIDIPDNILEDLNIISANHKGKAKGYIEDLVTQAVAKEKKSVSIKDGSEP